LVIPSNLTLIHNAELLNIHNAFHQGQYQQVVDFDTSSFSRENAIIVRVLKLRAKIALGQTEEVLADVEGEEDVPDLAAAKALAQHVSGDAAASLGAAEKLAAEDSDNATVQVLAGTVLQAQGKSEEALALLAKHQGNLEA
jgi:coatomer subunit epsilon